MAKEAKVGRRRGKANAGIVESMGTGRRSVPKERAKGSGDNHGASQKEDGKVKVEKVGKVKVEKVGKVKAEKVGGRHCREPVSTAAALTIWWQTARIASSSRSSNMFTR